MSLRFLLGPAGSGKTHACLDEICRELVRDPLTGPPLYFLVPEQATYQMERALLAHRVEVNAAARARVVSFKRLASLVLQDEGRADRPYLDETGKLLALQAVVSRLAGQLKLFQGISKTEGFLEQLAKVFSELRAHRQTPQSLRAVQEFFEGDEVISAKLHDIALLYEAYQQFISERFRDPDRRARSGFGGDPQGPGRAGRRSLGRRLCGIYASRVCGAGVAPFRGSAGHHRAVHRAQRTGRRRLGVVDRRLPGRSFSPDAGEPGAPPGAGAPCGGVR